MDGRLRRLPGTCGHCGWLNPRRRREMDAATHFPPSFDGSPLSYGFALFSLTLISALSAAHILHFAFDARARQEVQRRFYVPNVVTRPTPLFSAASVYRMIIVCFLTTVLFGAVPDVLFLMCWGEASTETLDTVLLFDRIFDGLTLVPFAAASFLSAWSSQALPQQLTKAAEIPIAPPTWRMVRERIKIFMLVLAIALMATIGKASA